eukprot:Filipodium_phascolosomae@DN3757_c0_g1_i1.p1
MLFFEFKCTSIHPFFLSGMAAKNQESKAAVADDAASEALFSESYTTFFPRERPGDMFIANVSLFGQIFIILFNGWLFAIVDVPHATCAKSAYYWSCAATGFFFYTIPLIAGILAVLLGNTMMNRRRVWWEFLRNGTLVQLSSNDVFSYPLNLYLVVHVVLGMMTFLFTENHAELLVAIPLIMSLLPALNMFRAGAIETRCCYVS